MNYKTTILQSDPEITLKIPAVLLRDLVLRSEENGSTVEHELAKRLARTLERDLEMVEEDNFQAKMAFTKIKNDLSNSNNSLKKRGK